MTRRDIIKSIVGSLPMLCTARLWSKSSGQVYIQTLEHTAEKSEYVNRWSFATKEEAKDFACSLLPELIYVEFGSGGELRGLRCELVSRKNGKTDKVLLDDEVQHRFWSIGAAWAYLSNMRICVDGKQEVIQRGMDYLTERFHRGNPVIVQHRDYKDFAYVRSGYRNAVRMQVRKADLQ